MKITPKSIALTTQTECRMVHGALYELPTSEALYGPHDLFRNAVDEHRRAAMVLGPKVVGIANDVYRAVRPPEITGEGGWRKAGTLEAFEPHVVQKEAVTLLAEAALLVALQPLPHIEDKGSTRLEFDANGVSADIKDARLLTWILNQENMLTKEQAHRLLRVRDRPTFQTSVAEAATSLLNATYVEFMHAVQGGPICDERPYATGHDEAFRKYKAENPLFEELARR